MSRFTLVCPGLLSRYSLYYLPLVRTSHTSYDSVVSTPFNPLFCYFLYRTCAYYLLSTSACFDCPRYEMMNSLSVVHFQRPMRLSCYQGETIPDTPLRSTDFTLETCRRPPNRYSSPSQPCMLSKSCRYHRIVVRCASVCNDSSTCRQSHPHEEVVSHMRETE